MQVRYIGDKDPVTFVALGREVHPGDVFDIPDDGADGYLTRADVVPVEEPKPARKSAKPAPAQQAPDNVTP